MYVILESPPCIVVFFSHLSGRWFVVVRRRAPAVVCPVVGALSFLVVSSWCVCAVVRYLTGIVAPCWSLWRVCSVVEYPSVLSLYVSACCGLPPLPPLRYQAWHYCAQSRKGCTICVIPVLLGSRLVHALRSVVLCQLGARTAGAHSL